MTQSAPQGFRPIASRGSSDRDGPAANPARAGTPELAVPPVDTRERLLRVAIGLFAEHGIDRISLKTISDEAGNRNKSAVGYHFESKQGLIDADLGRLESELGPPLAAALTAFERTMDDGRALSVDEFVARLLEPVFALYRRAPYGPDALRILARIMHDPVDDVPRELRRAANRLVDRAVAILRRLLPDKPADDIELQVHHSVMATVNGLALLARFVATREVRTRERSLEEIFLAYAAYLSAGLSSRAPASPRHSPHQTS
jgi:AcrR family transcriptional regulator